VAQQHESAHESPLRDVHRIVSALAKNATILRQFDEAELPVDFLAQPV
jgi:hypothetical protein